MFRPYLSDLNLTHPTKNWRRTGSRNIPGSSQLKYIGLHKLSLPKRPRYAEVAYGFINLYVSHPTHIPS
jgi:hypothetical protein